MCAAIGVDPLASAKGFWSVLGMGDFFYELSVQVVEVCLAHNHITGKANSVRGQWRDAHFKYRVSLPPAQVV